MSKRALVGLIPVQAPSVPPVTLDPANTNSNLTLSNGNLTLTCGTGSNSNGSRSLAHHSSGKFYYEAHLTTYTAGTYYFTAGIGNASFSTASNIQGWDNNNSVGWRHGGGVYSNAGVLATIEGYYPAPVYLCIAVDLGAKLFWGRVNGGNWNNNAAYDPAAGTGGIDISGMASFTDVHALVSLPDSTDVVTMNFGASAYAYTKPLGFLNWGQDPTAFNNFISRTSGLDSTHIAAYKALLDGLTADGLFNSDGTSNYLDALYILATQDATTAKLNLVSSSYTCDLSSTPTFTADQGYGVFSGGFIYTNFNAATAGGHYSQDSASMGCWCYDAPTNGPAISGSGNIYPNQGGSAYFRINDSPETGGWSRTATTGFYLGNRSSSTARQAWINGVSVGSYASAPSGTMINANSQLGASFSTALSAAVFGGSLDATQAGNLYTRLRTYMTAVGVP